MRRQPIRLTTPAAAEGLSGVRSRPRCRGSGRPPRWDRCASRVCRSQPWRSCDHDIASGSVSTRQSVLGGPGPVHRRPVTTSRRPGAQLARRGQDRGRSIVRPHTRSAPSGCGLQSGALTRRKDDTEAGTGWLQSASAPRIASVHAAVCATPGALPRLVMPPDPRRIRPGRPHPTGMHYLALSPQHRQLTTRQP